MRSGAGYQPAVALFGEALDDFPEEPHDDAARVGRALAAAAQGWFLSHVGEAELGADRAGEAVETLEGYDDVLALLKAIQCRCAALTYLSRWEEARALASEGITIADEAGDEWWAAELKPWLAVAELRLGDSGRAAQAIDESEALLSRIGEHRARTWNLLAAGVVAMMQERPGDAISISWRDGRRDQGDRIPTGDTGGTSVPR